MGVTDLKYNNKEHMLQGSVKLFTNDFESTLKKLNQKTLLEPYCLASNTICLKTKCLFLLQSTHNPLFHLHHQTF